MPAAHSPSVPWQTPHGRALPKPGARTLIMGVLNLTPDSFSDGGELPTTQAVLDRAGTMLAAGADILDLGGESTRPGSAPVSASAELDRVLPGLSAIRQTFPQAPLSIDTYKPEVARAAILVGADIVNDVWGGMHGLSSGQRSAASVAIKNGLLPPLASLMAQTVAELRCPVILMHNRPDKNYGDFWADFIGDLQLSLALAQAAGVAPHQIWLDPGFGFAKEPPHNLEALKHLDRVVALGYPVLLGTSRKSTIGRVLNREKAQDRLAGTAATLAWGIQQGCSMVRIHDVAELRDTLRMADAIKTGLAWKP